MKKGSRIRLIKSFAQIIKKKYFFLLIIFLLFSLPGENFYEKLRLVLKESLVREPVVSLPGVSAYPFKVTEANFPSLTARSAMVIDAPSKVVMFEKNAQLQLPPASTTKMMTALVALESYQLGDVLVVPDTTHLIGRHMNLSQGEKITVENLLYGLLVQSANDAALVLAANHSGGIEEFIYSRTKKLSKQNLSTMKGNWWRHSNILQRFSLYNSLFKRNRQELWVSCQETHPAS